MNVMFVSQCTKRALTETRRILDQFAERRGERTWQTPITEAGLQTVRRLLRQSARKNTAVACHWIRGRDHSELLWVVGDARQFNAEGAVPTGATKRDVLRGDDENTWHQLETMGAMTALAALLHDLGKATHAFQARLREPTRTRNHYRHEWVSVRLFQAFVGDAKDDAQWLSRLSECADPQLDGATFEAQWLDASGGRLLRDGLDEPESRHNLPFATLPPLAQAVAWLVLTHHRMPCRPIPRVDGDLADDDGVSGSRWRQFGAYPNHSNERDFLHVLQNLSADWNEPRETVDDAVEAAHWHFPLGLPVQMPMWRKQASRYARKLLEISASSAASSVLGDPFAMHVSRLCLMLADHHYSSIEDDARRRPYRNSGYPLYANTLSQHSAERLRLNGTGPFLNQTLDEHLLGVQAHASLVARSLPTLTRSLPALQSHRGLKRRNADARFRWQDTASECAAGMRVRAAEHGAFIVNMASTGCGKTLGNARIMNALADPKLGMRCAFAIGLRTLTLQTGRVFQRDLDLTDEQLAIKVGGVASRALFDYWEARAEETGSASAQALLDEGGQVLYEGDDRHPLLQRLTDDAQVRSLIAAPLLVCTVDHLTPATESLRGGRQIAPMLRLMTSDLVLDEPDDFDMADLPALTRLVHWAGLLGARVLLSSATLPPSLVQGLYLAYLDGRSHHQRNRGARPDESPRVACLWVDEFSQSYVDCADGGAFEAAHSEFVRKRCVRLAEAEIRRRARLVPLPEAWLGESREARREALARLVLQQAWTLHQDEQNHSVDSVTGKRVSFGVVRMANIDPLFDVALAMYRLGAPGTEVRVHLCTYHAQFPLLARSHIEQQLDAAFDRRRGHGNEDPIWGRQAVRSLLDAHAEPHQMFIVLASPVCEVGRDWDADWAIAEPSSMRALIQLAGRVRRHRAGVITRANLVIFDTNLRYFERRSRQDAPVFCKPGFELMRVPNVAGQTDTGVYFHLNSHRLGDLLALPAGEEAWPIDARPRISPSDKLRPRERLADLEHGRMRDTMLPRPEAGAFHTPVARDATRHWYVRDGERIREILLTGLLPQLQRFRLDLARRMDVALLPTEDEDEIRLHGIMRRQKHEKAVYVDIRDQLALVQERALSGMKIGSWCHVDLLMLLQEWAETHGQSLRESAEKLAIASLPEPRAGYGWRYHPALGFSKE
jgi:CRISPR-associated endonuclease/helicase Cas3